MHKKVRISLRKKSDLETVDADLDSAMERIAEANQRVGSLLSSLEEAEEPGESEAGASDGDEASPPEEAGGETPPSQT